MSKTREEIDRVGVQQDPLTAGPQPEKAAPRAEYSEDGVDLTLIRWMLSLTPDERLDALEHAANDLLELRAALD